MFFPVSCSVIAAHIIDAKNDNGHQLRRRRSKLPRFARIDSESSRRNKRTQLP